MEKRSDGGDAAISGKSVSVGDLTHSDVGRRTPGRGVSLFIFAACLTWALFQVYISSPVPFFLGGWLDRAFVLNETQSRSIHFAFAVSLAFLIYPLSRRSAAGRIPVSDWLLSIIAAATSLYLLVFHESLQERSGLPTATDIVVAVLGVALLLEAARRSVGLPLTVVSAMFIAYAFLGPYLPDMFVHQGSSVGRMATQMWLSTEGVFGIAIGVSTSFVFMFVMFGAILEKAGAGNYFIQLSFALLGHKRGGPAKAAVVSSGLTGMISGSAIANIVTTGTFTIPLMKRVGFPAQKAAAVEVSSSINGQIMPPIMGAAAFLMTEFIGISYFEVIKHAFVPALISYIGLYFIVHIEAAKLNVLTLEKRNAARLETRVRNAGISFAAVFATCAATYYGISGAKSVAGSWTPVLAVVAFLAVYGGLLRVAAGSLPPADHGDRDRPVIPPLRATLLSGLYFLLPVVILVWCLMVERFSPALAIFWATLAMGFVTITHKPALAWMRRDRHVAEAWSDGLSDLIKGMATGARIMVAVAISLAASGIIVGVVAKTGLGLSMTGIISGIAGESLVAMLALTALVSLILGMGLPTTANYIVVSAIMVPIVVELASQGGLALSLISVHLFVFYFGIMSGTTPPVAVDAFAGAAVARSDPFWTSVQSFYYSIRTAILPFIFVFNQQLILVGVENAAEFVLILTMAVLGMLAFVGATQQFLRVRNRHWETAALVVVALTLVWPGYWMDKVIPRFDSRSPGEIAALVDGMANGSTLRMWVEGRNFSGEHVRKLVTLPVDDMGPAGLERLKFVPGLSLRFEGGDVIVSDVRFGSPAFNAGIGVNWRISTVEVPSERPSEYWLYVPGLALFGLVFVLQTHRLRSTKRSAPARESGTSMPKREEA